MGLCDIINIEKRRESPMNQDSKKTKFVSILSKISDEKKEKAKKNLSEHNFNLRASQEKGSLFDYLILSAIIEQTDSMSLIYGKPHEYQVKSEVGTRLGKEALEALEKAAILRPTRMGPLTLIG